MQVDLSKLAKPVKSKKRKRVEDPAREGVEVKEDTTSEVEIKKEVEVKEDPALEGEEVKEEETVTDETPAPTEKPYAIKTVPKKEKKPLSEKQLAAIEKRKQANAEKKKLEEEEVKRKEDEIKQKEEELKKKKEAAAEKRRLKKVEKQTPTIEPVIKYIEKTIEVPRNDAKTRFELEYERGFRRMGQAVFGRSYQISKRMC